MFSKLRDKLKSWISSASDKIKNKEVSSEDNEIAESEEEISKKADKLIEDGKKQDISEASLVFNVAREKYEPDLDKIKEEIEEKIEKTDQLIEKSKYDKDFEIPLKFETASRKFEPDVDKIKEKRDLLDKEIKKAKKLEKEIKEVKDKVLKKSKEDYDKKHEDKKGFFSRIKSTFSYKISEEEFSEIFNDLELLLLDNNVALEVVEDLRDKLSNKLIGKEIKKQSLENVISEELKNSLNDIIIEPDNPLEIIKESRKPFVILFFGVNGTGKTTSIAKITNFLKKSGFSVVLAAGDTFRAASIEQLSEHANNLGVHIIKQNYGADPASIGYDAVKYAKKHNIDVVLIDTAGRMHTKSNLIEEMKKIEKVTGPDLKIFVAESIAGNDAIEQARTFNEAIEIDGSILSKTDIDEKGGTVLSISHATNKPIFYLGTGQNYDDLELFNKQKFIESLGL